MCKSTESRPNTAIRSDFGPVIILSKHSETNQNKNSNLQPPAAAAAATPAATAPRAGVGEGVALDRGKPREITQGTILKVMPHTRTARWPRREQRPSWFGRQRGDRRNQGICAWRHERSSWP
jgi:hypothetical protein